ncbi:MAG: hypothetical protein SCM11_15355 [Bacillota bacterium]|nr:hypothetical protein [Bacillota bacterium]
MPAPRSIELFYSPSLPQLSNSPELSVKPEIPFIDGGFLIRLPNQNFGMQKAKANANKREQKLLEAFREAEFTKEDAAETLGISAGGAYKLLVRMSKKGLLTIKKDGKQLIYSMIKQ